MADEVFRRYANAYLYVEVVLGVWWFALMLVMQLAIPTGDTGNEYRSLVQLLLFHFGAPGLMASVVSQVIQNDRVFWWINFAYFIAAAGSLNNLLQLVLHARDEILWARILLTVTAGVYIVTTGVGLWIYVYFFRLNGGGNNASDDTGYVRLKEPAAVRRLQWGLKNV